MTQEMTSFVLRFVRELSEEQGARWRGLIQHVQSGAERNFATFAEAVQFMQGQVLESTVRNLGEGEQMEDRNPFAEMAKMWGDLGPQMVGLWAQTVQQVVDQSTAFRSQVDQAVAAALKAWGLPSTADRETIVDSLARLNEQVGLLAKRVEALEEEVAARKTPTNDTGEGRALETE